MIFRGLYLYSAGILCNLEWCIRQLLSSSIISCNNTSIPHKHHTHVYPLLCTNIALSSTTTTTGTEFGHVQGYVPYPPSQRTFIDYDPITGRNMRQAIRQQINIRVEKGPLYPNVFSSQDRCLAPTKAFSANTGYGCFAYVPLLWSEDARVITNAEFYRMHDHFYRRPERASYLELIGLIVGCVTLFVGLSIVLNESYHRRNFQKRIYVD